MSAPHPERVDAALRAFLAQMRREYIQRNPVSSHVPVPSHHLETLPDDVRSVLIRSMRKALHAADNCPVSAK